MVGPKTGSLTKGLLVSLRGGEMGKESEREREREMSVRKVQM